MFLCYKQSMVKLIWHLRPSNAASGSCRTPSHIVSNGAMGYIQAKDTLLSVRQLVVVPDKLVMLHRVVVNIKVEGDVSMNEQFFLSGCAVQANAPVYARHFPMGEKM